MSRSPTVSRRRRKLPAGTACRRPRSRAGVRAAAAARAPHPAAGSVEVHASAGRRSLRADELRFSRRSPATHARARSSLPREAARANRRAVRHGAPSHASRRARRAARRSRPATRDAAFAAVRRCRSQRSRAASTRDRTDRRNLPEIVAVRDHRRDIAPVVGNRPCCVAIGTHPERIGALDLEHVGDLGEHGRTPGIVDRHDRRGSLPRGWRRACAASARPAPC